MADDKLVFNAQLIQQIGIQIGIGLTVAQSIFQQAVDVTVLHRGNVRKMGADVIVQEEKGTQGIGVFGNQGQPIL